MRFRTAALGLVLLLATIGCERDPERADAAPRAVVPGVETGVARVETLRDTVDGFGRVAAEAEPPEVRDARTQLVDLEARRNLRRSRCGDEALGQAVAPRKELEAAPCRRERVPPRRDPSPGDAGRFGEPMAKEPLAGRRAWVIVRVPQSDAGRLASGCTVSHVADTFRDQPHTGTLTPRSLR